MKFEETLLKYALLLRDRLAAYFRTFKRTYRDKNPHSRAVFILKVALPSAVALFVGTLFLAPEFNEIRKIKIDVPKLESSDKISFTMDNGTFYGQGNDGMVFSLRVDNFKENRIDSIFLFSKIAGKLFLKDASWLDIMTDNGNYTQNDKQLLLRGDVKLTDDQNNKITTNEAVIDLENTEVRGKMPIRADTYFGTILGEGFTFKKNEKYIFHGKVKALIDSDKLKR